MKLLLPLFIAAFVCVSHAQEIKLDPSPIKDPCPKCEPSWKLAAKTDTVKPMSYRYQTARRRDNGDVEVWLKVIGPIPPLKYQGKTYPVAYSMQFSIFHCDDRRMSVDSVVFYDTRDDPLLPQFSRSYRLYRDPVTPGSVAEEMLELFCK